MREPRWVPWAFLAVVVSAAVTSSTAAVPKSPGGDPVRIDVSVAPPSVAPGGEAEVTVRLAPNSGFKLNRYPKIKVAIPAVEGLVGASEAAVGNDGPPPPDQLETNYFKTVDPVHVAMRLAPAASPGRHEIDAKLSYFYCVAASGFCAPAKVSIKIPVTVR